jgi:hypothetical protein
MPPLDVRQPLRSITPDDLAELSGHPKGVTTWVLSLARRHGLAGEPARIIADLDPAEWPGALRLWADAWIATRAARPAPAPAELAPAEPPPAARPARDPTAAFLARVFGKAGPHNFASPPG